MPSALLAVVAPGFGSAQNPGVGNHGAAAVDDGR